MDATPLSSRVTAPETLEVPVLAGYEWRPARRDDLDAMMDCARAIDTVDHPNYMTPREEVEEEFEHSYVDPARDSLIAITSDGRIDAWGFATLSPSQDTLVRAILFGGVRPEARGTGLGRRLLAWQEGRGLQHLASSDKTLPGWLMSFAETRQPSTISTLQRAGFEIARYYLELGRDLSEPTTDRALPDGLTLAPWTPDLDDTVRDARNDAFRDHWGSQSADPEQWHSFTTSSLIRRDLSVLAIDSAGDVAGFVLTTVNPDDWPGQGFSSGYIDLVGVRRAWRGRGVAPALLSAALELIRDAGLDKAVLDVDSENPSGALGLYEGVGFVESNRSVNLLKVF